VVGSRAINCAPVADFSVSKREDRPATEWVEALPIGNGRLGAMVFGGTPRERLQLNEDTVWNGEPHDYAHEGAVKVLPTIRQLLFEGRQEEAEALALQEFMSVPLHQRAYQPLGDLLLHFPGHAKAEAYRRALDLDTAITSVRYQVGDVTYTREIFASAPDQAIVMRITADRRGAVTFEATLRSSHQVWRRRVVDAGQLALNPPTGSHGRWRDRHDGNQHDGAAGRWCHADAGCGDQFRELPERERRSRGAM